MSSSNTPEGDKSAIRNQFGDLPELNQSATAYIKYRLIDYSPEMGVVRFEEDPRKYAFGETPPGYFVDYVIVDPKTKLIARRQLRYLIFRGEKDYADAEIEYRQDSLRVNYEIKHDSRSNEHRPQSAGIGVAVVPASSDLHFNLELASTHYWEDRVTSVFMTYGDLQSLEQYEVRKMEKHKRRRPSATFGGHDLSRPGADFEIEAPDFSDITLHHFGRFRFNTFRSKVQIGEVFQRPEIAPYSFLLTQDAGQIRLLRVCGLCEGEWTYLSPDGMDLEKLDKLATSKDLEWTKLYQTFPARLDMNNGIRPCKLEINSDKDEPKPPLSLNTG